MRKLQQDNNAAFTLAQKKHGREDAFSWVNPLTAGGWFFGTISSFFLFNRTFMDLQDLAGIYLVTCMVLFAIPYKKAVKFVLIRFAHWNIFCFAGLAPLITGLMLICNFYFAHSPQHSVLKRQYRLYENQVQTRWVYTPQIVNPPLNLKERLEHLNATGSRVDSISFTLSQGAFNFPVIADYYFHK